MIGVETIIECPGWRESLPDPDILATRTFEATRAREPRLGGAVALLMTDEAVVRQLNARFRNRDAPTNVLSFASGESAPNFLGDIALAYEICRTEAREQGLSFPDHVTHLITHGLLHLVGYDHATESEARTMECLETEILDALGVSDPYEFEETTD